MNLLGYTLMQPIHLARRRYKTLSAELVEALSQRIREGNYAPGEKLPKEADLMREFGVSRTVVREAISHLQAGGTVETRHGIGTFVLSFDDAAPFRVGPEQLGTLRDVISLLEVRIGLETECAALAAQRRTPEDLVAMRDALRAFDIAVQDGRNAVDADFAFHLAVARATSNTHFSDLMESLGTKVIPRSRLSGEDPVDPERLAYLRHVQQEHESVLNAVQSNDPEAARAAMRTHLCNSRERLRRRQNQAGGNNNQG